MHLALRALVLAVFTLLSARPALAAPPTKAAPAPSAKANAVEGDGSGGWGDEGEGESTELGGAKSFPGKVGPAKVSLGHDLTLDLSGEHVWLEPEAGRKLLAKSGSFHNENLIGVVLPKSRDADWWVTLRYDAEGFVKDDEKVDADELLKAIKEGTEEGNKERGEKGFKPLRIDGWTEPPRYDSAAHHLVWALAVSDDDGKSINYNTRVLGRRGYVSVNLVVAPEALAQYKPEAARLLAATTFDSGARYQDFDKKTDKVAEYGLAGLILGGAGLGAAKLAKVGLFAKFGGFILAFFAKGFKLIAIGVVAAGAFLKKLFSRKSPEE